MQRNRFTGFRYDMTSNILRYVEDALEHLVSVTVTKELCPAVVDWKHSDEMKSWELKASSRGDLLPETLSLSIPYELPFSLRGRLPNSVELIAQVASSLGFFNSRYCTRHDHRSKMVIPNKGKANRISLITRWQQNLSRQRLMFLRKDPRKKLIACLFDQWRNRNLLLLTWC